MKAGGKVKGSRDSDGFDVGGISLDQAIAASPAGATRSRSLTLGSQGGLTVNYLSASGPGQFIPNEPDVRKVYDNLFANLPGDGSSEPDPALVRLRRERGSVLDLVKDETERIDSRFLESACGSGNFLVQILRRKLAAVELKYGKSDFERRHYALLALMCIYGIELLADNIAECRANVLEIFAEYLNLEESDELYRAASYVLSENLVHGDALTMRTHDGNAITFAEWGYLGKGKFQRRDFSLATLTQSSAFSAEGSLFAHLGKHEIFTPEKTYPPMTMSDLASMITTEAQRHREEKTRRKCKNTFFWVCGLYLGGKSWGGGLS